MRKKVLGTAATVLVSLPAASFALGLGDIQLKSSLNAPLDAEIELVGATPEELAGLKVQLASRDTFARYGIDYPTFLNGISVHTARSANGKTVVQLRSSVAMTEPFVTVLVEANYGRGRQVREYSVLLDPPVFAAPTAAPSAPVAAAVTGNADRSGGVSRPAKPVAAPSAPAAGSDGGTYRVRGGDTLSRIASNIAGGSQVDRRRAMLAIYRANPGAFDGNMNLLRSGAVLRLPDAAALAAIDPTEAGAEIRRQSSSWQGSGSAALPRTPPASNQLKLVPPADKKAAAPLPSAAAAPAQPAAPSTQQLQQRLTELEAQLADARRALEQQNKPAADTATAPSQSPAGEAATPDAAAPAPAVEPKPAAAPAARKAPPAPAQTSGVLTFLKTLWYVPAGLVALIGVLFGLRALRRRREEALDLSAALDEAADDVDPHAATDVRSGGLSAEDMLAQTQPLRIPNVGGHENNFLVEEGRHATGNTTTNRKIDKIESTAGRGSTSTRLPTIKAGTDHSDPIAEADFHMAYGLYDQAADLIRQSIQREPSRRDLKLKLLEIYFVWGNKAEFLSLATELSQSRDQGQAGEWDKVLIMGRQLAPEAPLFDSNQAKPLAVAVDHNLEGGQNQVDFDLIPVEGESTSPSGLDFDLNAPKTAEPAAQAPVPAPSTSDGDTRLMPVGGASASKGEAQLTQELAAFDDMGLDVGTLNTALHQALDDSQIGSDLPSLRDATVRVPVVGTSKPAIDITPDSSNEWNLLDANAETLGVGDTHTSGLVELTPPVTAQTSRDEPGNTQHFDPPSMSEIGTKLDLARAYIDMGDPDGARSILAEVLAEGGDAQKQEAQRLLDGMPG